MKTALITGASRGIGKACAVKMAACGYNLFLVCEKNIATLEKLCEELHKKYNISAKAYKHTITPSA